MTDRVEYEVKRTQEFVVSDVDPGPYKVGQVSPISEPKEKDKELPGFASSFAKISEIGAISRIGELAVDRAVSLFDPELTLDYKDPDFDTATKVEQFEKYRSQGILQDDDFGYVMQNIDNQEAMFAFINEREEMLDAYAKIDTLGGLKADAARFVAEISGPSVLLGFGAAKMLSSGMSRTAAFGISGAAAGATSEGIKQAGDLGEVVSQTESAINIGAAALFSGLLGKGADIWAARAAKTGKDFNQFSREVVTEVTNADKIVSEVGAAKVERDPNLSKVAGNMLARGAAYAYRGLSAKARGVTAIDDTLRRGYDRFVGRSLDVVGDTQGVPRQNNFVEEDDLIKSIYEAKTKKFVDELGSFQRAKKIRIDEVDLKAAVLRSIDQSDTLADDSASALVARSHRKFFGDWDKDLKNSGIEGYGTRDDYGVPMLFRGGEVNKRFDEVVQKLQLKFSQNKDALIDDIAEANERISGLEQKLKKATKENQIKALEKRIEEARVDLAAAKSLADSSDELLADYANKTALALATGDYGSTSFVNSVTSKILPNRFRQRVFDIKEWIDFIEVDPVMLQRTYTKEVSPFLASQKTLGYRTPDEFVASISDDINDKIIEAKKAGNDKLANRLKKELTVFQNDAQNAWDDLTGGTINKFASLLPGNVLPATVTIKAATAATSLGAALLPSLNELNAIIMTHGLKGLGALYKNMGKALTSPEYRRVAKEEASHISYGVSTAVQLASLRHFDEVMKMETIGTTRMQKIARGAQAVSNFSQVANGMVTFTSVLRSALTFAQQGLLKESMEKMVAGKLSEARLKDLNFLGISSPEQARRILAQIKKHGTQEAGILRWNIEKWDDNGLADLAERVLFRDNRRTSLQPDVGDTPHAFRVPGVNLLFQFKSWAVTAGQVYGIRALQRADRENLTNLAIFIGLSSAAYQFAEIARGNEIKTDVDELIYAGVTNSGILGVMPDYGGHYIMSKLFDLESGGAKFAERQTFLSTAGGPLVTKMEDVQNVVGRPLAQAIDPERQVQFDDVFWRNLMDLLPIPFVKPYIKNELLTDD